MMTFHRLIAVALALGALTGMAQAQVSYGKPTAKEWESVRPALAKPRPASEPQQLLPGAVTVQGVCTSQSCSPASPQKGVSSSYNPQTASFTACSTGQSSATYVETSNSAIYATQKVQPVRDVLRAVFSRLAANAVAKRPFPPRACSCR